MRKKILLIIPQLLFAACLFAQPKMQVADLRVDKFVIKLVANTDSTYGYEIYDADKVVVRQKAKPYSADQTGFREKQNAMIIAIWQANELSKGNNAPVFDMRKAKELGVTKEDL